MKYLNLIKNFDAEKLLGKLLKQIKKEDVLIFITVLVMGIFNFFYCMSHIVLSPDGLTYGPLYKSGRWELELGRPLLAVLDRLRGGLVSPPVILFFSLIYIALSIMILRRIFPIKKKISLIVLSLLFVLFPTVSDTALFIYCFDGYCLSLLFSILGIYFIKNKKYLFSICSIIISLSLYQAYISITITGVLILFVIDLINKKESIKSLFLQMFIVFIGLLSYFILLKIGIAFLGITLADYKGASSFGLETILSFPKSILHSYQDFYWFFLSDKIIYNHYYHRTIIHIILFIILLRIIIPIFLSLKSYKKILLLLALLLLPLTINVMDLIACETRINLITAIGYTMFYLLLIVLIENYSNISFHKSAFYLLSIILFYTYFLSNSASFQVRVDIYNHFYTNSMIILTKAKSLDGYKPDLPWMFNNTINYTSVLAPASNDDIINTWETFYGYWGIKESEFFYKRFLGEKIYIIEEEEYNEMKKNEEYQSMEPGDVKIINGIIVVKITENDL